MADGYRVSKTVNDLESRYLWDNDDIVADMNGNNVISHKYYRGVNLICDDSNNYYMHDSHGNIIETYVKGDNYCYNWYRYNAFGTNKHFDDTDDVRAGQPWGYCDQYYDWETQNYYMRARYYNPASSRFITEDPIKDGSNWYSYCNENPIKYIDSNGKIPVETIIDVASIGWSFKDFVSQPNVTNFGFLAWDVVAAIVPYAPGSYVAKSVKSGTKIISKSSEYVKKGVWKMGSMKRGWEIEKALGGMCNNFQTIDKFVESFSEVVGLDVVHWLSSVTSIKSIDISAKSYKNASNLKRVLKRYVDDVSSYYSKKYKGEIYSLDKGRKKILEVAIPPVEMSKAQANVFDEIVSYAKEKGVTVITRIIG